MVNGLNIAEDESISDSIYESSTENDSDDVSIITNFFDHIWDGNYVHPYINARDARLKIRYHINKSQI